MTTQPVEIPVLEGQTTIEDVIEGYTDCESCGHAYADHAEESCEITERWCQCPGYWGKVAS